MAAIIFGIVVWATILVIALRIELHIRSAKFYEKDVDRRNVVDQRGVTADGDIAGRDLVK